MKGKVVLLIEALESLNVLQRKYISDITDRGYSLEVWVVEKICYPDFAGNNIISYPGVKILYIKTKRAYCNLLKDNRGTLFFDFLGDTSLPNLWIRAMLGRMRCRFYIFLGDQVPNLSNVGDGAERVSSIVENNSKYCLKSISYKIKKKGLPKWLLDSFNEKIYGKVLSFCAKKHPPNVVFMATHMNYVSFPTEYSNVAVKYLHTWNYEKYIRNLSKKELPLTGNYIVYLDQAFANHPDFKRRGIIIFEDVNAVNDYYNKMKHFFDVIEEHYQLPVKIAGHPSGFYKGDEFGNRDVIVGQTEELISSARLVIVCYSTSVSFAALYKKPIMLINNFYLKKVNDIQNNIMAFQICFKTEPMFIEEIDNVKIDNYLLKDMCVMESYVRNYVKEDSSPDKCYWDIVFEFIENEESCNNAGNM